MMSNVVNSFVDLQNRPKVLNARNQQNQRTRPHIPFVCYYINFCRSLLHITLSGRTFMTSYVDFIKVSGTFYIIGVY